MLIARAPMRISFGGGGTDLEAYYAKYGGLVVSTSINKYFYAVITSKRSTSRHWSGLFECSRRHHGACHLDADGAANDQTASGRTRFIY